jgi:hypothetical protein
VISSDNFQVGGAGSTKVFSLKTAARGFAITLTDATGGVAMAASPDYNFFNIDKPLELASIRERVGQATRLTFTTTATNVTARFAHAKGADVAAAGTTTLGNDGNLFGITGTGTIDFITTTNWQAGSRIVLRFAAAATVNHNTASPPGSTAPILLSGAANITFAANTILELVYDGTNWIDCRKVA